MKKAVAALLLIAATGCAIASASMPTTGTLEPGNARSDEPGQRQRNDGDTLRLLTDTGLEHIRLSDIDAPETSHGRNKPGQAFSQASRKHLLALIAGKALQLQCFERDRYDRAVCAIFADGQNINLKMLQDGYAWPAEKKQYIRFQQTYGIAARAKEARSGLWRDPRPVAPWEWRRACWERQDCGDSGAGLPD